MQEIATLKSIIYGLIITFIFMVSSCEFEFAPKLSSASNNSQPDIVAINH